MRFVRLALLLAAVAGGTDRAAAQVLGTTGGGVLGGTTGGTGGTSSSTTGGGTSGAFTGSSDTGTAIAPLIEGAVVGRTELNATSASTGGTLSPSNFLGGTYSNPYYQGLYSNPDGLIGGFGRQLYTTTGSGGSTSGAGNTSVSAGARASTTVGRGTATTGTGVGGANPFGTSASPFGTTTAGRTGTQGGQFGAAGGARAGGGFGGAAATSQFGGQVIPLPRNIAYSAVLNFRTPVVAPAERLADVQAVIARSTQFSTPAGVTVVADGTAYVLRGQVGSEDEARLAEGLVRLTPGVREVRNELTFPKQ